MVQKTPSLSLSISVSFSVSCSFFFFFFELLQVLLLDFFNKTENLSVLVSCLKWHV